MADKEKKVKSAAGFRRSAREVKRYVFVTRLFALLIGILVALIAIAYAIAYFYDKFGSFTVKVNKSSSNKDPRFRASINLVYYLKDKNNIHLN